jgi:hypothetical protein
MESCGERLVEADDAGAIQERMAAGTGEGLM